MSATKSDGGCSDEQCCAGGVGRFRGRVHTAVCLLCGPAFGPLTGSPADGPPQVEAAQRFGFVLVPRSPALPQQFVRRYYRKDRRKQPLPSETVPC